ncbi:small-conductance mechanosensitive channel MscS [Ignatzschineria rhizosphaerae]|uniref:Small-conductance mechanosensitive channel n=1 Tax=Ignatzschineria rhizosphaerae TaxID=2923279 RepID=A0ABY3X781_9GAMM|nr:small-conductance mechanosensitive channel MscS [Ignatzschineria rhizosphaerae]UNM97322.1 small-conductance mechanosensitive channel MscS [Ignatzschineria rhizosphaerae]
MNTKDVTDRVDQATGWLISNETLIMDYIVDFAVALLILFVGLLIAKWVSRGISRMLSLRKIDATISGFIAAMIRYTIIAFTLIAVLGQVGIQTTSIIAVLGAAGLAVGLALQGSLSNFAAGVLLVIFRPLKAGEYVKVGSIEGTVTHVEIFSTTLLSADGHTIIVPNSNIIKENIINISREPDRRTDLIIGVAYDSQIEIVKKILNDIVANESRILQEKGITIRLNEMGASSLNYIVRYWTKNGDATTVRWELLEQIKNALDQNNIAIPFPQMEVYLHPQADTTKL